MSLPVASDAGERGRLSDPQDTAQQQVRPLPGENHPPTAKLYEVYDLKEIDIIRKVTLQSMREGPTIHDQVERPGDWDPAGVLRGYRIFQGAGYVDQWCTGGKCTIFSLTVSVTFPQPGRTRRNWLSTRLAHHVGASRLYGWVLRVWGQVSERLRRLLHAHSTSSATDRPSIREVQSG